MLGKCFFILCAVSIMCGVMTGNMAEVSNAVVDGAAASVTLTLTLVGNMCLWCGILEVLRLGGLVEKLSRLLSPMLRIVFPDAWKRGVAKEEITAALSAYMLGMGNAATPFAIEAMKKLKSANAEFKTIDTKTFEFEFDTNITPNTTIKAFLWNDMGSMIPLTGVYPIERK